jgi:2-oxoacid:acceptor oxidoreductase delta subunit (pyruvate/2-ketoisovalerate family)
MKIPHSQPGTATQNKTGDWRSKMPVVNKPACIKCGNCERFCPDGAAEVKQDGAEINYNFCKGCGVCANECPVKCISMVENEKK